MNKNQLGRFAQNSDADEATAEYGEQIITAMIDSVGELVDRAGTGPSDLPFLPFDAMETAWTASAGAARILGQLRAGIRSG